MEKKEYRVAVGPPNLYYGSPNEREVLVFTPLQRLPVRPAGIIESRSQGGVDQLKADY